MEKIDGRLPVETKIFRTPPNALRVKWQSNPGGVWGAEVRQLNFRNRLPGLKGTILYIWCYTPEAIAAGDLPMLVLSNRAEGLQVAEFPGSFTAPVPLGKYAGDFPAGKWMQVRIPLKDLQAASIYPFHPEELRNVIFHQGKADGVKHTMIVDEIRIGDDEIATRPAAPLRRRKTYGDRIRPACGVAMG